MAKVHYIGDDGLENAPPWIQQKYAREGYSGSLCGYLRKNTTCFRDEVTCFYCKRILKGLAKR